jgi:uncharacterized repeat protein (TIGR02543 family)
MRRSVFVVLVVLLAFFRPALATTQLIVNGGFEATSVAPWVLGGTLGVQVVSGTQPNGVVPYDGAQFLQMGDASGAVQYAYQTVMLPTNLIAATLALAYDVVSSDTVGVDELNVYITDTITPPDQLFYLGTASSTSPTGGWILFTTNFITYSGNNSLSSYAGRAVNVYFSVETDATYGYLTSFYLDDVSLTVATTADIPGNNYFTNATLVPTDGITNAVITEYTVPELNEPKIGNLAATHPVWYNWTAPAIGTVTIATTGSSFDTLLGVFTGSSLTNLTAVTNSDGINRSTGLAYLTFPVARGAQYDIVLSGYESQSGNAVFILSFAADKTLPVVKITSPANGADVTNSTVVVTGTASDIFGVVSVYYQLSNASGTNAWQLATGTNSWSATVTNLIPGTNTVRVEAYDTATNLSKVAACLLNYVIPTPLSLKIVGDGTVAGAANGKLLDVGYPYTLTATAAPGFLFTGWTGDIRTNTATLRFTMTANLSLTANFVDVTKPTLSITAPLAHERWSNSVFNVTGTAKENVGVASVWLQVNNSAWTSNVNSANGWTNWNASVTVVPGTNTIRAYAVGNAGNISLTNSVSFIYVVSAPLTVQTNGKGTIKPDYNNAILEISNSYTMTATAASGYVFSNWTALNGEVVSTRPTLKFTMESNLNFTANFVPNPFTSVAGTYQGLFYDTSNTSNISPASSGFFSAQVTGSGSFTAKFQHGNASPSVSGQFSLTGGWSTNALKAFGNTAISLQLDLAGGNVLEGGLTNEAWVAQLQAYREVFSAEHPAPQQGKYTLILPGTNSETLPGGNGFGAVNVTAGGSVSLSGTLGDGTKVTPTANVSETGFWPVYFSLDGGNGMLLGWLTFTIEPTFDIDGLLYWFKPAEPASALYKAGFTNQIEAVGSAYSFKSGEPVLDLTSGYVLLQEGGLAESISNQFTLAPNNTVTGSDKLKLIFAPSTGLFQGSVTNGSGKTISITGAVLQKQTNGFGQFINGEQSGSVNLAPQ